MCFGVCSQCEEMNEKNKLLGSQSDELTTLRSLLSSQGFTPTATTLSATATSAGLTAPQPGASDGTQQAGGSGVVLQNGVTLPPTAAIAPTQQLSTSAHDVSIASQTTDDEQQQQSHMTSSMRDVIHKKVCSLCSCA